MGCTSWWSSGPREASEEKKGESSGGCRVEWGFKRNHIPHIFFFFRQNFFFFSRERKYLDEKKKYFERIVSYFFFLLYLLYFFIFFYIFILLYFYTFIFFNQIIHLYTYTFIQTIRNYTKKNLIIMSETTLLPNAPNHIPSLIYRYPNSFSLEAFPFELVVNTWDMINHQKWSAGFRLDLLDNIVSKIISNEEDLPDSQEDLWLYWYSILYQELSQLTDRNLRSDESNGSNTGSNNESKIYNVILSLFVGESSFLPFDIRYQAFLNIVCLLPCYLTIDIIFEWIDMEIYLSQSQKIFLLKLCLGKTGFSEDVKEYILSRIDEMLVKKKKGSNPPSRLHSSPKR